MIAPPSVLAVTIVIAIIASGCVDGKGHEYQPGADPANSVVFAPDSHLVARLTGVTPDSTVGPEDAEVIMNQVVGRLCAECNDQDSLVADLLIRLPGLVRLEVFRPHPADTGRTGAAMEAMVLINRHRLPAVVSAAQVDSVLRWALSRIGQ